MEKGERGGSDLPRVDLDFRNGMDLLKTARAR
jgi:hypothetical protein